MKRRRFLRLGGSALASAPLAGALFARGEESPSSDARTVMTVTGPIDAGEMGRTLSHEHVMVDFADVETVGRHRYDRSTVVETVRPHLEALVRAGGETFVDCTPAYLGRDPVVLRRLSKATGLQILTNTGYYGARDDQHVPEHAYTDSVDELAARWVKEWEEGIGESGVRPGFIKIGVDDGSLSDIDRKLVRAACRAHRQTGLTVAVHTGPAQPAFEQLDVLQEEGVAPRAWIWVHAQNEDDSSRHVAAARRGAWVSLDGYSAEHTDRYRRLLTTMRDHDVLDRVLISHDNGWYSVGTDGGGDFAPYTPLFENLIPALRADGWSDASIRQLLVENPAEAFAVRRRTAD